jgi:hypothetical protein
MVDETSTVGSRTIAGLDLSNFIVRGQTTGLLSVLSLNHSLLSYVSAKKNESMAAISFGESLSG